jgi:hypothetical protein
MEISNTDDFWLRLDNAAKIYPAVKNKELTSVLRVGVYLKERIKVRQFLEAIYAIEERFPYYKVKLKAGFFWYYLEPQQSPLRVEPDRKMPCRAFDKGELMFRVLAEKNKMSVEFSHILTDGTGAMEFLKTLLLIYFGKCGIFVPKSISFIQPNDIPIDEEYEDAFKRYFKKIPAATVKIPPHFISLFP